MVEYITGINGVGKTRIMCEACINTAAESKGNVIFIDASDKLSTVCQVILGLLMCLILVLRVQLLFAVFL